VQKVYHTPPHPHEALLWVYTLRQRPQYVYCVNAPHTTQRCVMLSSLCAYDALALLSTHSVPVRIPHFVGFGMGDSKLCGEFLHPPSLVEASDHSSLPYRASIVRVGCCNVKHVATETKGTGEIVHLATEQAVANQVLTISVVEPCRMRHTAEPMRAIEAAKRAGCVGRHRVPLFYAHGVCVIHLDVPT